MRNPKNAYFAITYYQIVYAILHSQQTKTKSKLFVATDYLNMDQELFDKLNNSSFFEEVIFFKEKDIKDEVFTFLENEKDFNLAGQGLKNKIEQYYKDIIKLDDNDTIFVFNIKQLFYGYIYNLPNKMVLVEDGYRSIKQQLKIHKFKGRYTLLEKFEGSYFPKTSIEDIKFEKFVINNSDDASKLKLSLAIEEYNYVQMIKNLTNKKVDELLDIFDMNKQYFDDAKEVVLVLTQPLARAKYCNIIQQYLIYKRLVTQLKAEGNKVIIKLHPADKNIYMALESDNVEVIDTPYPVDLMLFKNRNIKKVYSYGSTATDIMGDQVECNKIFAKENFVHKDVSAHIKQYIKNTRLKILVSGQAQVSNEVLTKANYQNPYLVIEKHNTNDILATQKYALSNEFDYFIYDEVGTNYSLEMFKQLYKVLKKKIVMIYSFSTLYQFNGREYLQESNVYNHFLKFSYFDKLIRSNIKIYENTIDTLQSLMLSKELKSYLIKTRIKVDYHKAEKLFISIDQAKNLIKQYQNANLEDEDLNTLIQNINMNIIGLSLICVNPDKLDSLKGYLDTLSKEQLAELMYITSFTFLNSKIEKTKKIKYTKKSPKKFVKKLAKKILRIN